MSAGPRRAHGTGSLETRTDKYGREIYYGRFYVAGRQVKRKLGVKRRAGESTGLTKTGAERALQKRSTRRCGSSRWVSGSTC